jgi:hypothetical protein
MENSSFNRNSHRKRKFPPFGRTAGTIGSKYWEEFAVVMAGCFPAIHVFAFSRKEDVDTRHKAGHDNRRFIS